MPTCPDTPAEENSGLKVVGIDLFPWDPATGEVSDKPLTRPD